MLEASYFSFVNVGIGFFVSLALTYYLLPFVGIHPANRRSASLIITTIYTVAAIIRNVIVYWGFNNYG